MIKAILFDADGVIQSEPKSVGEKIGKLVGAQNADKFIRQIFKAEKPGLSGHEFLNDIQKVLDEWELKIKPKEAICLWNQINVMPDLEKLLNFLKSKGIRCLLGTNQSIFRADFMKPKYSNLFDYTYYSCDIGASKPSVEFFEFIIQKEKICPEFILFIDDLNENLETANALGFKTIQADQDICPLGSDWITEKLMEMSIEHLGSTSFRSFKHTKGFNT